MSPYVALAKAIASLAAAYVCGIQIKQNKGASGIGWFVLAIYFIWL